MASVRSLVPAPVVPRPVAVAAAPERQSILPPDERATPESAVVPASELVRFHD